MPNTTGYSFGDVVLVRFPFTDQRGSKQRPAVVVSSAAYNANRPDVILMAITSQLRDPPAYGEVRISHWQSAGLLKDSAIKPVIFTAEKGIVRKTLGQLADGDQQKLLESLRSILAR